MNDIELNTIGDETLSQYSVESDLTDCDEYEYCDCILKHLQSALPEPSSIKHGMFKCMLHIDFNCIFQDLFHTSPYMRNNTRQDRADIGYRVSM